MTEFLSTLITLIQLMEKSGSDSTWACVVMFFFVCADRLALSTSFVG